LIRAQKKRLKSLEDAREEDRIFAELVADALQLYCQEVVNHDSNNYFATIFNNDGAALGKVQGAAERFMTRYDYSVSEEQREECWILDPDADIPYHHFDQCELCNGCGWCTECCAREEVYGCHDCGLKPLLESRCAHQGCPHSWTYSDSPSASPPHEESE
tara:strand:- start:951 stop:1430 length:480 start_codon:yes stop_codon:yes gene_type:complete